jgi:hypothetical protein
MKEEGAMKEDFNYIEAEKVALFDELDKGLALGAEFKAEAWKAAAMNLLVLLGIYVDPEGGEYSPREFLNDAEAGVKAFAGKARLDGMAAGERAADNDLAVLRMFLSARRAKSPDLQAEAWKLNASAWRVCAIMALKNMPGYLPGAVEENSPDAWGEAFQRALNARERA